MFVVLNSCETQNYDEAKGKDECEKAMKVNSRGTTLGNQSSCLHVRIYVVMHSFPFKISCAVQLGFLHKLNGLVVTSVVRYLSMSLDSTL
jgi:hypothetical protein